jgi:hypothetical protein
VTIDFVSLHGMQWPRSARLAVLIRYGLARSSESPNNQRQARMSQSRQRRGMLDQWGTVKEVVGTDRELESWRTGAALSVSASASAF